MSLINMLWNSLFGETTHEVYGTYSFLSTSLGFKNMFNTYESKQESVKSELPTNLLPIFDFVDIKSVITSYKNLKENKVITIHFDNNSSDFEFDIINTIIQVLDAFEIDNTDLSNLKNILSQLTKEKINEIIKEDNKEQIMIMTHTNREVFKFKEIDQAFNVVYFEFYKLNDKIYCSYYFIKFTNTK